ncbi:MAG TPA: hypothetical protein VHZ51_05340 [Ktedonobacteraceae bacterium]|nr:hypothetical protein [Ktedonobacteraceae bacterium]
MHICLVMDNPETPQHPVIAVVLQQLCTRHTVRLLDVNALSGAEVIACEKEHRSADLYLLKSHSSQALDLAQYLEQDGRQVVNSWSSSLACQDRLRTTELMRAVNLPWPPTWHFFTLTEALKASSMLCILPWPLIIKSRYNYRGDLVVRIDCISQLQALAVNWSQEPVVFQECIANNGWDIKLWVIDEQIFAAYRRTPLEANACRQDFPVVADELPLEWKHLALAVGRAFKMSLYGVDLIITQRRPVIVDVNAFPGFRGAPGAGKALINLVERLLPTFDQRDT